MLTEWHAAEISTKSSDCILLHKLCATPLLHWYEEYTLTERHHHDNIDYIELPYTVHLLPQKSVQFFFPNWTLFGLHAYQVAAALANQSDQA